MKINKVKPTKYCAGLINSVDELVDGKSYDLGAIHGVYCAKTDSFSFGNGYVPRINTIYSNR